MIKVSKNCRLCLSSELEEILYLCDSPPANNFDDTFIESNTAKSFPLVLDYCDECFNIQLRHCLSEELLYSSYTYATPASSSLTKQYQNILDYLQSKLNLSNLNIVELGSNNGALLDFLKPFSGSVLGVDPASNIAKLANENGIETLCKFFNLDLSNQILDRGQKIDIVIARHMFAHNSDPHEILLGIKNLLKQDGTLIIENAYAFDTLLKGEFDQIYHEHMFYYSACSMKKLLAHHGIFLNDIFMSEVHGGSIAFVASCTSDAVSPFLESQLELELSLLESKEVFLIFKSKINSVKSFVMNQIDSETVLGAYGAPAKAFTMFSYLGLDSSSIRFCVDTTPTKIDKIFPVSNIPIISESALANANYDSILVTAWNYKEEIIKKSEKIFKKGTKLIFPLPEPSIHIV
jgi:SAM-dependent methyltransferase